MIIIRDDDVLLASGNDYADAFNRFQHVHEIICEAPRLLHVPGVITEDLQNFPEAIHYMQIEIACNRMKPQLHGLRHIDYGQLSFEEVLAQLTDACAWFLQTFGYLPTKWYTPWGASQPHLYEVGKKLDLEVVDCNNVIKFKGRHGVTQLLKDGRPFFVFR